MPEPPSRTTRRQRADARAQPQATDRVYERDFDKVRPRKLVPGVVGRSRWFAERAGEHEHALSLERLQRAINDAENLQDTASLRAQVLGEAHALLAGKTKTARERTLRKPSLLDIGGRPSTPTAVSRRKRDGITAVSPPLEAKNEGFLFVPVDESVAATLDLETVMVAEISDPLQPLLNETFSYWPQ
jgi:hypothetical protein